MSYSHLTHQLVLTEVLVAAHVWTRESRAYRLRRVRACYELARSSASVTINPGGRKEVVPVVPDAWLEFERVQPGGNASRHPLLLEIARGTQFQHRFKRHILSRVEYIDSDLYKKTFGTRAVLIAYAATGAKPEFSRARLAAIRTWTREVLEEERKTSWASIFRFHAKEIMPKAAG